MDTTRTYSGVRCRLQALAAILLVVGSLGKVRALAAEPPFAFHPSEVPTAFELRRLPPTDHPAALEASASLASHESSSSETSSNGLREVRFTPPDSWEEPRLYLGYDGGFLIAADGDSVESDEYDFLMRVNSWTQLRHTRFESDGPNPDQNSFSFERLRLSFSGHAFSPDLEYFFQFDGNSDRTTVVFLDYFLTYDIGHQWLGLGDNLLGVKFGKWKVPFSRSREETGRALQFTDRASPNVFFDLNRSIGVGITTRIGPHDSADPLEIETAIFNGFRTGNISTDRGLGLDNNFGASTRGHIDLFGEFGSDGEPDLGWHDCPALRLGAGLAITRVDAFGTSEFGRQRGVDSGTQLSALLPMGTQEYDIWLYTVDAHFKYHGLAFIAEYYWRSVGHFKGTTVPNLHDDGFVLQTGYFVIPERLEFIARWGRIVGDSGTLGRDDQSSDEVALGFVWYLRGHNAKVTFDTTHIDGVPISNSRLDMLPGDAGWMFRTQCQVAF